MSNVIKSPKVSILIPCYNAERWVGEAIESALTQTYPHKEVIVVDDGSTDGSLKVIKSFGDKIRWETGPNRGGNVARNRLLELSNGEWLQYLDADDYLLPNKIEQQLAEAADLAAADLLWSPSLMEYQEPDQPPRLEPQQLQDEDPWIALIRWRLPQTGASLWRKQAIIDVGGWKPDQPRCQEHELYFRLLKERKNFQFCPSALSVYRQWSEQTVCRKDPLATTKTRMAIVDECETHLRDINGLSPLYEQHIFATRIECARSIYSLDRQFAISLSGTAGQRCSLLSRHVGYSQPVIYRFVFQVAGFTVAEWLASTGRSLLKPFSLGRRF